MHVITGETPVLRKIHMESANKSWDAAAYDGKHSFVWKYGEDVIELLNPQAGERILDLGCGTGHLTNQIAARGAEILGIDASPDMIAEAKKAYPDLRFEISDAREFVTAQPFDAIFSNAVLHWIRPPERVIERIAANLKPGGRLVAEFGGKGNIQTIERAIDATLKQMSLPPRTEADYNFFPGIAQYSGLLESHGLETTFATLFDRMTPLKEGEAGLRNWVKNFRNNIVDRVPEALRNVFFKGVEERSREELYRDGKWSADYRRIRVVARKPRG